MTTNDVTYKGTKEILDGEYCVFEMDDDWHLFIQNDSAGAVKIYCSEGLSSGAWLVWQDGAPYDDETGI